MAEDEPEDSAATVLDTGEPLYDENGTEVGVVRDVTEGGVEVDVHGDVKRVSLRRSPGENFGEGYLLWRCGECGEMGDIDRIPAQCPNCGTEGENIYAYLED